MDELGITTELRVMMRQMHRIISPGLQRHDYERSPVPNDKLDIVRISSTPGVLKHDGRPGIGANLDQGMPERGPIRALTANRNMCGNVRFGICRNGDDRRFRERSEGPGTHTVRGHVGGTDPGVTMFPLFNGDPRAS